MAPSLEFLEVGLAGEDLPNPPEELEEDVFDFFFLLEDEAAWRSVLCEEVEYGVSAGVKSTSCVMARGSGVMNAD